MNSYHKKAEAVLYQVNQVILGKEQETAEIFLAFLADGHVLLEDIPGIGKTTMALGFTRSMDMECRRVQFTPDVLPSDLTGFSLYKKEEETRDPENDDRCQCSRLWKQRTFQRRKLSKQ